MLEVSLLTTIPDNLFLPHEEFHRHRHHHTSDSFERWFSCFFSSISFSLDHPNQLTLIASPSSVASCSRFVLALTAKPMYLIQWQWWNGSKMNYQPQVRFGNATILLDRNSLFALFHYHYHSNTSNILPWHHQYPSNSIQKRESWLMNPCFHHDDDLLVLSIESLHQIEPFDWEYRKHVNVHEFEVTNRKVRVSKSIKRKWSLDYIIRIHLRSLN